MSGPGRLPWESRRSLERHFRKHGRRVGARDAGAYLRSARETVQLGAYFTYEWKSEPRIGYYHRATGRFTALSADGSFILTHYPESEDRVRRFPASTYP